MRPSDKELAKLLRATQEHISNQPLALRDEVLAAADALSQPQDCYHGGCECIELRAKLDALTSQLAEPTPPEDCWRCGAYQGPDTMETDK